MSRTFIRIVILISLTLFIILMAFSFTTFISFENIFTQRTYDENIKEMGIISDNIRNMHEIVKNYTYKQIDDPTISPLFEKKTVSDVEAINYLNIFSDSFKTNPLFHSVTIYSGTTGNYFSTLSFKADKDTFFTEAIQNHKKIQELTPIPRELPFDIYGTNDTVFAYMYFETDSRDQITRAMAVNLNAAWLCDNLSKLKGKTARAYIIDRKNGVYIDESSKIKKLDTLNEKIVEKIKEPGSTEGSFEIKDNKEQKVVTYLWMRDTDWVLAVEEPNTFIQQSISAVRRVIIQITLGIALLAGIAVFLASRTIYKPFGKLFSQIIMGQTKKDGEKKVQLMDDVKLISDAFDMNQKKLSDYSTYKNVADVILLENYIKAVLLEDNSMANELTGKLTSVFESVLEKGMMLILLKIDSLAQFEKLDSDTKKAYRFSIMNVSEEVLDVGHTAKAIHAGEGKFIVLTFLQDNSEQEKLNKALEDKIRFVQQKIKEITGISLSAFIGGYANGSETLRHAYNTAYMISRYSVLYSKESFLDANILERHTNTAVVYDEKLEEKILEMIRAGNSEEAKAFFDDLIAFSQKGDIENFILSITRFSLALGRLVNILNNNRIEKIQVSMKNSYYKIASFENIDDLKNWFYELIENVSGKKVLADTRNDALVESIKKYIDQNYSSDLSLKGISAEFKLSQGYIGTIFKETVGISVLDYINNVKLGKAAELLNETELSIADIMKRTGFLSESNFFKLFKKKYGATPKNYRVDKQIIDKLK